MEIFLRIKHWQLFMLMVIPLGTFILLRGALAPAYLGLMLFLFLVVASGWIFSVGLSANEKLDSTLRMQTVIFKISFAVPLLYMIVFYYFFVIPLELGHLQRPPEWIVPLHFASVAAIFYLLWFASKQFVTCQHNREVFYIEYWSVLLGFWFGFIGVWFLQPKVNRLFDTEHGDGKQV